MKIKRKKYVNKEHRRGRRKSSKNTEKSIRFLAANAAGIKSKLMTFKKVLNELNPSVFFIEETKLKEIGQLKIENYILFEKVRENRDGGGGLAIGALRELDPVWVKEGKNKVETLSINIFLKNMKIRCCVAYGFQESDSNENKEAFWQYLDEEVEEAKKAKAGLVIQMDGNLWAGRNIIPNDPKPQNKNGKLLEQFLIRNSNLTVVNSMELCEGLITRRRIKAGKLEESVLDFFLVCNTVLPHITKMVVDEEEKYILTNYRQVKYGGKATNSDHFTQYLDLDLKIITEKPNRREIWNLKNKEAQKAFKYLTTNTKDFTSCFEDEISLNQQIENWRKSLKYHITKSFKKIRINNKKGKPLPPEISKLINKRNMLSKQGVEKDIIVQLDETIAKLESKMHYDLIRENFEKFKDDPEKVNIQEIWKTMSKLWPKCGINVPTAKINHVGKMVSAPSELKALLAKEYRERLRKRPLRPDLKDIENRKQKLFEMKLSLAESKQSSDWTMDQLEVALKDLKNNKTRDNDGFINEIFKKDVIGKDLKESLLKMFNRIKNEKKIPKFMNIATITTVPKKGSKLLLENERGIFRLSVLRSIIMRLIYNEKYDIIDKNMSDSQMGARKKKGCRQNIFIINGIIHDIMSSKAKKPINLQIYDYKQMFDAINLKEAIGDIYDAGLMDDKLSLLYQANKEVNFAVNTPSGLTERQTIEDVVLQGDTWGSILASVQVDSVAKEVEKTGYGFKYKDILPVSMLGLVDDIIGITAADYKAHQLNTILKVKTAEKRLQFGVSKCKTMLVSKNTKTELNNGTLTVDNWCVKYKHDDETGENTLNEKYVGQVNMEQVNTHKYLGFVLSNTGDNSVNISAMRKKSIWIIRRLFKQLEELKLQKYYFECGIIFLHVILRSSILYACETYYYLKENQIRQLERIEEGYLRKLFQTTTGCPIVQLYLESGVIPARFAIKKARLMFLKSILEENPNSMIHRFITLQIEQPTKGDWISSCQQDLIDLDINLSFEEITKISKYQLKKQIKESISKKAFEYLIKKQGSKGKEMKYTELQMAEYLQPNEQEITIQEQRNIFAIRNKMIIISDNYKNTTEICQCGQIETMEHIYNCKQWNDNNKIEKTKFEEIYKDNILKQVEVSKKLFKNLEKRQKKNTNSHVIQLCDPLLAVVESSNGL